MEIVKQLIPLLLTLSLGLLVVAAGLASSRGDFAYVLKRPRLLLPAFVAIMVIPILAAMAIVALFPLSQAAKAGILLMAISPVPPLMPGKALKAGGHTPYVYGLMATGAVFAVIFVPILGALAARFYGVHAQFPVSVVARNILIGVAIPLVVGLVVGRVLLRAPAPRLTKAVTIAAYLLLVLAALPILIKVWPAMMALIGNGTVLAMILVVVVAIAGGHFLGGDNLADRGSLAISAAMRHPGIALALAGANHANAALSAAVLLFLIVGFLVLIPYQMLLRRQEKPGDQV
ncbi:Na+-dependent transporter [Novosphingobium sp. PhB55]|uniref:Na+-dependent transporter n=1 Tax=unclassified Novosphingobium TaxID=2644732 RepID=UPI001065D7C7|nr:Na+-dependent transporter [Novosphingobium sp. PhB55]TDW68981.1 BASS family bile acid:Na+ symporter [Novosphingobium sp. PhB55]